MNTRLARSLFAAILLMLAASFGAASVHAQQIINGGFELDVASSTINNPGTGWTFSGNPPAEYIYSNSFNHGQTPYGSQWSLLTGGAIAQTVTGGFVPGQAYELHFSAADVEGGTIPRVNAIITGAATASQSFALPQGGSYFSNGQLSLVSCTLTFVPVSAGSVTFNIGTTNYPVAIDNVYLVPEPSTWTLLGLGAAGLGSLALLRRRTHA